MEFGLRSLARGGPPIEKASNMSSGTPYHYPRNVALRPYCFHGFFFKRLWPSNSTPFLLSTFSTRLSLQSLMCQAWLFPGNVSQSLLLLNSTLAQTRACVAALSIFNLDMSGRLLFFAHSSPTYIFHGWLRMPKQSH